MAKFKIKFKRIVTTELWVDIEAGSKAAATRKFKQLVNNNPHAQDEDDFGKFSITFIDHELTKPYRKKIAFQHNTISLKDYKRIYEE